MIIFKGAIVFNFKILAFINVRYTFDWNKFWDITDRLWNVIRFNFKAIGFYKIGCIIELRPDANGHR